MNNSLRATGGVKHFDPHAITRPSPVLLRYYAVVSLLTGPFFPVAFIPLLFKYETLRYRFDEDGIAMSWGLLFRREVYLTYRRIQDIHHTRGIIQRWMGLATVAVQTASGSATPEMSIEGILEVEPLRDFLYSKMRGAREEVTPAVARGDATLGESVEDESLALLREIRTLLWNVVETRRPSHE
ncbi:MAG: PH domain-containing protein [Pirellulaceae bacterium]